MRKVGFAIITLFFFIINVMVPSMLVQAAVVVPTVQTLTATEIASNSAILNGQVIANGGATISEYGFRYCEYGTGNYVTIHVGTSINKYVKFSARISGLKRGVRYSFYAYAKNSAGFNNPQSQYFTTNSDTTPPSISIIKPKSGDEFDQGEIVPISANASDNVGISRLVIYINGNKQTESNSPVINFRWDTSKFSEGDYEIRVNAADTSYNYNSSIVNVSVRKKIQASKPQITTLSASSITDTTAVLNGKITSDGNSDIIEYGFWYGAYGSKSMKRVKVGTSISTNMTFDAKIPGLEPGTKYSYYAYAINEIGASGKNSSVEFTTTGKLYESVQEITIDPSKYDKTESMWSEYMDYEPNAGMEYGSAYTHAFGGKYGQFTYKFQVPIYNSSVKKVTISAQLSSDFIYYSGPEDGFSDVNLIVNGNEYPSQRVIVDDGHGKIYTWDVNATHLKQGDNTVSFTIKPDSQYKNGLCIYYVSKVAGEQDEPIRVKVYADLEAKDTIPPIINMGWAKEPQFVSKGSVVQIKATATDNVDVCGMGIYIDGNKVQGTYSGSISYDWDTNSTNIGIHTIRVTAVDPSNHSSEKIISVIVGYLDNKAPTIKTTIPRSGENEFSIKNKTIIITFSEEIKMGESFRNIKVQSQGYPPVEIERKIDSINRRILTLTRKDNWAEKLTYTVTIPTGAVSDLAGNPLENNYIFSFKTIAIKVPVTNITLNNETLSMVAGGKNYNLIATVLPSSATNKTVSWSSSDTRVATVDSKGLVTSVGPGKCLITAEANDGTGIKAICAVMVKLPATATIMNPYGINPKISNVIKLPEGIFGDIYDIKNCLNVTLTTKNRNKLSTQMKIYNYSENRNYFLNYDLTGKKDEDTINVEIHYDSPTGKNAGWTHGYLYNGAIVANIKDLALLRGLEPNIVIYENEQINKIAVTIVDGDYDGVIDGHYDGTDTIAKDIDLDPFNSYKHPVILIHGRTDNSLELFGLGNTLSIKKDDTFINQEYGLASLGNGQKIDRTRYVTFENQKIQESMTAKSTASKAQLGDQLINAGFKPNVNLFVFNYPAWDMIHLNSNLFADYIFNIMAESKKPSQELLRKGLFKTQLDCDISNVQFDLVGHSMGGLIARYYVENGIGKYNVNKIITLDTPHWGGNYRVDVSKNTGILFTPNILDLYRGAETFGYDNNLEEIPDSQIGPEFRYGRNNLTSELKNLHMSRIKYYAIGSAFSVLNRDTVIPYDRERMEWFPRAFYEVTGLANTDDDGAVNIDSQLGLDISSDPVKKVDMNKVAIYYTNDIKSKGYPTLHQWMTHDSMVCRQVLDFLID